MVRFLYNNHKKHTVMNKNKNNPTIKDGNSTRGLIVSRANEIINSIGMVDFRIDYLAQSLAISPGNITYHFPRKDDISSAIWLQCQRDISSSIDGYITPFIDIKQLYLFYRNIITTLYAYRGVTNYMLGDCGVIDRERVFFRDLWRLGHARYDKILDMLTEGGYIKKIENQNMRDMCYESQVVVLGWWINHSLSTGNNDVSTTIDYYAFVSLFSIFPFMTEKSLVQYNSIQSLLVGGEVRPNINK